MTDLVLNALKIILLLLIYAFFARVLWAVWSEVRTPVRIPLQRASTTTSNERPARTGTVAPVSKRKKTSGKGVPTFVIVEPRDVRGQSFTLANVLSIGRHTDADISMPDDTFMSGKHASLEIRPDGVWINDLSSTNGTFVNGRRVTGDASVRKGDRIQAGSVVLERTS
jgi:pSer/pThr/pTyr-binding forkhead associated (FHA) protein